MPTSRHSHDPATHRGGPVLHLPLVVVRPAQRAAPVQLDVELVRVHSSPVDVHAVVVIGVSCQKQPGYPDNGAEDDLVLAGDSSVEKG